MLSSLLESGKYRPNFGSCTPHEQELKGRLRKLLSSGLQARDPLQHLLLVLPG